MYQNISECIRIFQNVPECTQMFLTNNRTISIEKQVLIALKNNVILKSFLKPYFIYKIHALLTRLPFIT